MTAVYARRATATRWCVAVIAPHAIITRCRDAWVPDAISHEIASEVPPLADRCLACFPTALVQVGLRELAACAIEVSFDAYERLAARGEPGAVATEIIDQALGEEMGAS